MGYIKVRARDNIILYNQDYKCLSGRSAEVALTPSLRLVFQSTEKPGHLRDGWAKSAWVTTANSLDVQLAHKATVRSRGTHESDHVQ